MCYKIKHLSDELVYIQWKCTPTPDIEGRYLADIQHTLHDAKKPLYFVSDLRRGQIVNVVTLQKLGKIIKHANYAGSTAFSKNPVSEIFVGIFSRFSGKRLPENEIWETPEDALSYLEALKPGITDNIDWDAILNEPLFTKK